MNAKTLFIAFILLCLANHSFAQSDATFQFSISLNRDKIYDYSYSEPFLIRQITTRSGYYKNIQSDTLILNRRKQRTFVNYFQQAIKKQPLQEDPCAAASERFASLLWREKRKDSEHYYTESFYPCISNKRPFPERFLETFHFLETFFNPEKPLRPTSGGKWENLGSDYVILAKGDTIYGKRYRSVFNRHNIIRFRTDTGKIKLPLKDVKEVYSDNKISWVYISPCDGRWEEYTVYLKGNVSYLWNGDQNAYCSDMLVINNEIYPIDKPHFSDKVWNILSKCHVFEEKYKAYHNEHKDKKLFWRTRKDVEKWLEMIRFYNANYKEYNPINSNDTEGKK